MRFSAMRDYIYHRVFQNTSSEIITQDDVVFAINTAMTVLSSQISHPLLCKPKVFTLDSHVKKITKLEVKESVDSDYKEIKQTHNELKEDTFIVYNDKIETYDEYYSIRVSGEFLLPYISNTETDMNKVFPLGVFLANAVCEYCMSLLIPANLIEGYNLAQYHESVFYKMMNIAAKMNGGIVLPKNIENKLY